MHAARRDCHSLIFATSSGPQTPSPAAIIAASIKADIVGRPGRRGVMSSEHAEARDDCREGRMTAAVKPPSLLRTATGEPRLGRNAEFFADDQGEIFEHDNPRHRSSLTRIGVPEFEGGKWLAMPP